MKPKTITWIYCPGCLNEQRAEVFGDGSMLCAKCGEIVVRKDEQPVAASQEIQPTMITVDADLLRRALAVAEHAHEFEYDVLAHHDSNLGRKLLRHKQQAELIEDYMRRSREVQQELMKALGYTP